MHSLGAVFFLLLGVAHETIAFAANDANEALLGGKGGAVEGVAVPLTESDAITTSTFFLEKLAKLKNQIDEGGKERLALSLKVQRMQEEMNRLKGAPASSSSAAAITTTRVAEPKTMATDTSGQLLRAGLKAVEEARADILAYYANDEAVLDKSPQTAAAEDSLFIAKMAKAINDADKKTFTIGVDGSSVSAGHDNFLSTAWPSVLERILKPVWSNLGMDFKVINGAVGARDPNPWPLCFKQILGPDVDVVIHEAEYWEFEAGYNDEQKYFKAGADKSVAALEILIRNVLRLPNQPALHFMKMSYRSQRHGALDWMKKYLGSKGDLAAYRKFSFNGFDHFGEPYNHLIAKNNTRIRKPQYPGELIDDQTGWKPERILCTEGQFDDVAECPVDADKPDGFHSRAKFIGFNPNETHVDEEMCKDFVKGHRPPYCLEFERRADWAGNSNLFVNW
jgi:hypothetical protein